MGFTDKLKFWKKEDEDFSDLGDFGLGEFGAPPKGGAGGAPGVSGGAPAGAGGGMPSEEDIFGKGFGEFDTGAAPGGGFGAPQPAEEAQFGAAPQQQQYPAGGMAQQTFPTTPERMETQPQPQQMQRPMQTAQPQQIPPQYSYAPSPQPQETFQRESYSKDIEIISAKLDSLRATLDSINQRLANLERIAQGEQDPKRRYEW
ncbi:MAG: hypothetical protein KJ574_04695 [Nanoarchaeota archaeon]|nr:hypothetical protein [Nanoarchaeota archaeon]